MEYKEKVNIADCDWNLNLSLVGFFVKLQNAVTAFMVSLNYDGSVIRERFNCFWVYAKAKVKYLKDVKWNENIIGKPFFSSKSEKTLTIDVPFYNENNELCLYSKVVLCSVNGNTNKVVELKTIEFDKIPTCNPIVNTNFENIDINGVNYLGNRKVCLSNIDFNYHMNNVEYIRFILDSYHFEELKDRKIKSFQIVYINSGKLNDLITIYKREETRKDTFVLKENERLISKAMFKFK